MRLLAPQNCWSWKAFLIDSVTPMGLPNAAWIHFSQIWFQFTRTNRGFVLKRFPYFRFTSTRRINFIKSSLKIRVACPLRNCSNWMRRYVRRKRARAVYTLRWSTNKTQNTTRTKEHHCAAIERFSIECRESKTKEVTLASHNWHRQSSEQSKFKANACGRREERENVCKRVAIGWFRTTEGGASFLYLLANRLTSILRAGSSRRKKERDKLLSSPIKSLLPS